MNSSVPINSRNDRLLSRMGGSYLPTMQALTQLVSFLAATIGIYYIIITAHFNETQVRILIATVFSLVVLVNLLIPAFTLQATKKARTRLNMIFKNKPNTQKISDEELEVQAWAETIILPRNYAIAELATAYILVVVPSIIFMIRVGQATTLQAVHIGIGGLLSATIVVVQNGLFLDYVLAPVRRALLPRDPSRQNIQNSVPAKTRMVGIIGSILFMAIGMLGPLGYQKLLDAQDGTYSASLQQYLIQASIIAVFVLITGIALGLQLSNSVSRPIREMITAMNEVKNGNLSRRAVIVTSDETAEMTIQLNQLLDQLQSSQRELEQKVEERTAELTRKALQLQASAQIARDTAAQRDIGSLLERTVDLVSDQFGFYHTGIFLIDETGEVAILQAASSEGGKRMLSRGHRLDMTRGVVGAAIRLNKSHIASDVGADQEFFNNPDLPGTRSEAAIPLSVKGKVIGALDIQSTEPAAFSQEDLQILQTMADQIALAIQNARLISESQNAFARLESATTENMRRTWRERTQEAHRAYRYTAIGVTPVAASENHPPSENTVANKITIPITLRGQRIGNIQLNRKGNAKWAEADRTLAIEIANQVGLALENARLLEEAQRHAAQEQSISDLTARLSRSLDIDTLLQTTLRELYQLPNVLETSVYISAPYPATPAKISTQENE